MVYVPPPPSSISTFLSAHLAVVFHPARWKDEGVKAWGGGGMSLHLLWGPGQAHETAGVLQKPIIEVPAPPLGKTGGGESVIVSVHR